MFRRYLFREPTLYSWLALFAFPGAIVYLVLGIVATVQSPEGIMVLLFEMYFAAIIAFTLLLDIFFRKVLKGRLAWVWIIELSLLAVVGFRYYYTKLYRIELVVNHPTKLVVLVADDERGVSLHKTLRFHSSLEVPDNNIVFLKPSSFDLLWYNLRIRSGAGTDYTNFYPMQYSDRQSVRCGDTVRSIQFLQLEIKGERPASMDDLMFDSVQNAVCAALNRQTAARSHYRSSLKLSPGN